MKRRLYSKWGIRDAYVSLRRENPGYLLAFGVGAFFCFIRDDADAIKTALPDVEVGEESGWRAVKVHAERFFVLCARLKAKGLKVATVSRVVRANNTVGYRISGRSDG